MLSEDALDQGSYAVYAFKYNNLMQFSQKSSNSMASAYIMRFVLGDISWKEYKAATCTVTICLHYCAQLTNQVGSSQDDHLLPFCTV